MSCVLRIHGLASGQPTPYDETYLWRFDFEGCAPGEMQLHTVATPHLATKYPDALAALEAWRTVDPRAPLRADGRPNRPLTAFSVTIEPVAD